MSTVNPYTVKPGDTLSGIAKQQSVSVDALIKANGLKNPDQIQVGQQLRLPAAAVTHQAAADYHDESWSSTSLRFVDALERPIVGMSVRVSSGMREWLTKTDGSGCIPTMACEHPETALDIFVERARHKGGGEKKIATYTPMAGAQTVKLKSGKHVHKANLRLHQDAPHTPPKQMKHEAPGTQLETRSEQGHPLVCIKGGECPNDDNLMLGTNNAFRAHIKAAAARAGVVPQAVAALMNAEAAKDKSGQWQARSTSPKSSATGMTQFLDGSWIDVALREGTHLNTKAKASGWLVKDAKGKWQFKKADGKFVTHPNLLGKLAKMVHPKRHASDTALQKLLDLRYEAEYAINAAMDYAKINLDALTAKGYAINDLNDTEKARIMYLCHHLGLGDAVRFIQEAITEASAKHLLCAQIGERQAEKKYVAQSKGSWIAGHRMWLDEFVGRTIVPSAVTCPGALSKRFNLEEQKGKLLDITDGLKK